MQETPCIIDGCDRQAALLPNGKPRHGGKCHGHAKRKTKEQPLTPPLEDRLAPAKRLEVAAQGVGDADTADDAAYKRALKRLYMAAMRLAKHRVQKAMNPNARG